MKASLKNNTNPVLVDLYPTLNAHYETKGTPFTVNVYGKLANVVLLKGNNVLLCYEGIGFTWQYTKEIVYA